MAIQMENKSQKTTIQTEKIPKRTFQTENKSQDYLSDSKQMKKTTSQTENKSQRRSFRRLANPKDSLLKKIHPRVNTGGFQGLVCILSKYLTTKGGRAASFICTDFYYYWYQLLIWNIIKKEKMSIQIFHIFHKKLFWKLISMVLGFQRY